MCSAAGESTGFVKGECTEESGEREVTSMDGERCRVVEEGELGDGESSGAGEGGKTKSKTRVAI